MFTKRLKYRLNKAFSIASTKLQIIKVIYFYWINKNKSMTTIIKRNRQYLKTIDNFLPYDVYIKNDYGVQKRIYDQLDEDIPEILTYSDLIVYLITRIFEDSVNYLEIGVSVLKNYLQINNGIKNSKLVAFDINEINPRFSNIEDMQLNNNILNYYKGSVLDISDTSKFINLYPDKFDFIFSDALHTPQAIRAEYNLIIKKCLSENFILYYDDLDFEGLEDEFFRIKKEIQEDRKTTINCYTFYIYGWIGTKEKLHKNGIITNVDLEKFLSAQDVKLYKFKKIN